MFDHSSVGVCINNPYKKMLSLLKAVFYSAVRAFSRRLQTDKWVKFICIDKKQIDHKAEVHPEYWRTDSFRETREFQSKRKKKPSPSYGLVCRSPQS